MVYCDPGLYSWGVHVKILSSLLLASLIGLVPTLSTAQDVTLTDWRGESATFTEGSVDSDGVKIVFHAAGEGPLVLFVHSISGPWFAFQHQMVMLSERYRVVSMSTRGTDKSDKPVGVEHYASARIADDLVAIIDHFGEETATVIGQDSGGLHVWNFAYTYPERTAGLISLGSIHPAGLIRELIDNPEQQQASTFQRGMQENPDAGKDYGERLKNRPPNPNEAPEMARLRQEANARTDPESIVGFYKANWPWSPVTMETEAFGHKFGEFPPVKAPTLFIYGEDSGPFKNQTLNDMWEWVEGPLTIHVLPGVGHGPHTQIPEFVTPRIMEWLDTGR